MYTHIIGKSMVFCLFHNCDINNNQAKFVCVNLNNKYKLLRTTFYFAHDCIIVDCKLEFLTCHKTAGFLPIAITCFNYSM